MTAARNAICRRENGFTEAALLAAAMDHLHAAARLFALGGPCRAGAACQSQLGLGLLLKALLLHHGGAYPATTRLHDLLTACQQQGVDLQPAEEQVQLLTRLDRFAAATYPDPSSPAVVHEADHERVHQLMHLLVDRFPEPLAAQLLRVDEPDAAGQGFAQE